MMTRHYPDLGSASIISRAAHEICFNQSVALPRSGWSRFISMEISLLVSQTSFHEENSDGITKCCLFSQAMHLVMLQVRPN